MTVDAAAYRGASAALMDALLRDRGSVRSCRAARRTLEWADGGSESPAESFSRGQLLGHGVPRPRRNVNIEWRGTRFRVDDWWEEFGIVGEADGRIKYEGSLAVGDTLWREKKRQHWLEQRDLLEVRWLQRR